MAGEGGDGSTARSEGFFFRQAAWVLGWWGGGGVGRTARTVGLGPWVVFSVEVGGGGDSTARSERKPRSCLSAKGAGGRHG